MKRLTRKSMAVAAVLLVLAIVAGSAAYGYFTSSRDIENNEVSSGSIILSVNDDGAAVPMTVSGIMPGDYGTVGNYKIENDGTVAGTLWVGILGNENGVDKFFDAGLSQALLAAIWLDADASGTWTVGDKYFVPDRHYVDWQTGDDVAVPALAYNTLAAWNEKWSNSLDVPGLSNAGILKVTYSLPAAVDDPALMNKKCNFDLKVELHQYHPDTKTVTFGSMSGHTGVTWTAVADGVVVGTGSATAGAVITLPVDVYDIVFKSGSWTWTKEDVDITISNFPAFDLPA